MKIILLMIIYFIIFIVIIKYYKIKKDNEKFELLNAVMSGFVWIYFIPRIYISNNIANILVLFMIPTVISILLLSPELLNSKIAKENKKEVLKKALTTMCVILAITILFFGSCTFIWNY